MEQSKKFWCKILGFQIAYQRPENRFVYIERQGSQVMLNQQNGNWETGTLQRPLGRGINFQMFVDSVAPLLDALKHEKWPLFRECHDAWYRIAGEERGNRQFLVQDPDGYLLRSQRIWARGNLLERAFAMQSRRAAPVRYGS
ncbi:VOC family protein, partial [Xanthomonas citri pv. citri]